jgi:hypothetical protein
MFWLLASACWLFFGCWLLAVGLLTSGKRDSSIAVMHKTLPVRDLTFTEFHPVEI